MTPAARVAAEIEVLDRIMDGAPAEVVLGGWARGNRFAGSKDRAAIRDHVFDALRRRRSYAALAGELTGRGLMRSAVARAGGDLDVIFSGQGYGPPPLTEAERTAGAKILTDAERLDCPDWLWPHFHEALGDGTEDALAALQDRAPVFLRVNVARATREEAARLLAADGIATRLHDHIKTALEVTDNARKVSQSDAFINGLVEVQDAASQAAVLRLPDLAGLRVLDYCAGGGGKALAMAALGAKVTAHDIDPARMRDLPARAARAGVEIAQSSTADLAKAAPFDLVFCDAPCSGSGTWRRNPEAKWALTPERLDALCEMQRDVLCKAPACLRKGGLLAYATCSVFTAENRGQVDDFLANRRDFDLTDTMQLAPGPQGDGFYLALMLAQ